MGRKRPRTGVLAEDIYRRLQDTTLQLIKAGHITGLGTYTDTEVVNGATYYYVVRWVDQNGRESADSNEASGTPSALLCSGDNYPCRSGGADLVPASFSLF